MAVIAPRAFEVEQGASVSAEGQTTPLVEAVKRAGVVVVAILSGMAIWLGRFSRSKNQGRDRQRVWLWAAGMGFNLSYVGGMFFGTVPSFAGIFQQTIGSALVLTAAYTLPATDPGWLCAQVRRAILTFAYGSIAAVILFPGWAVESHYVGSVLPGIDIRFHGVAVHANALGPLLGYYFILGWVPGARLPAERAHSCAVWCLFLLAQSKTAFFGLLVAYLVRAMLRWNQIPRSRKQLTLSLAIIALLGLLLVAAIDFKIIESIAERVAEREADFLTLTGRLTIWLVTLSEWIQNPLFGYGPLLWGTEMQTEYVRLLKWEVPHAHNQLVQTLGEAGLVGLGGLLLLVMVMGTAAGRLTRASGGASLAIFLLLLVRCISEPTFRNVLGSSSTLIYWYTIIILLGASTVLRTNNAPFRKQGPKRSTPA